ncbi:MAG: thiosulfohydrolase SoxB [bacterium]
MHRRDFLRLLAFAGAAGASLRPGLSSAQAAAELYDLPRFGNVSLLHMADSHAQLLPIYFREPSINLGVGPATGKSPHLVGEALLKHFGIKPGGPLAHAYTFLDFAALARRYGKVGGYAHLATLVERLRAARPNALLLDSGDTWQGSATALWSKGADMIGAQKRLGVDLMTAHWEFTYGAAHVKQVVEKELAPIEFLAQNVKTLDFEDPVFEPYTLRTMNGVPLAIIGQAFPYTPIANPRYLVAEWTFGIQERRLQKLVDEVRAKGAKLVVLLSHNGMDIDLKLAGRVRGIDAILGGHTHDGMPAPTVVKNGGGRTLVTNAGSNGKFLAVLDLDVRDGRVADFRYRLLPVFANLLPAQAGMAAHIDTVRKPHRARLEDRLALSEGLLYRRGNFNGSFDQLILDAMLAVKGAEIGFSPGFRWGTSILPGDAITFEHVMDQTAITYPMTTLAELSGFNPDPYRQQGGDMVRVGGMTYACKPNAKIGRRISDMRIKGKPIEAARKYKVAGWAPVAEGAEGEPIWDVVTQYLRDKKTIAPIEPNVPRLIGVEGNPGVA